MGTFLPNLGTLGLWVLELFAGQINVYCPFPMPPSTPLCIITCVIGEDDAYARIGGGISGADPGICVRGGISLPFLPSPPLPLLSLLFPLFPSPSPIPPLLPFSSLPSYPLPSLPLPLEVDPLFCG